MNIVISNPKTGKAYSKKTEQAVFLNKKIGEEVNLSIIGLNDYFGVISGGSDKNGFPMKRSLDMLGTKKVLISNGVGFNPLQTKEVKKKNTKKKRRVFPNGVRVKKRLRGNTVSEEIHQLNIIVTKEGSTPLDKLLGKPKEEEKQVEETQTKTEKKPVEEKQKQN